MPQFAFRQSLTAGTVVTNAFAGSAFEFVRQPARVTVRASYGTAVTTAPPVATIQFGSEVQYENAPLRLERIPGAGPSRDDQPVADDIADGGDRLVARIQNADTVTHVVDLVCDITYL